MCITNRPKVFLGHGQAACEKNIKICHGMCANYWKMLDNLGAWNKNNPRYLQHKMQIGGGECVVDHQREIIPVCVLREVRHLYPNLPDKPYMGHKWAKK
jgi:hypothetical protein